MRSRFRVGWTPSCPIYGAGIGGAIYLLVIGAGCPLFSFIVPRVFLSPSLLAWCGFLLAASRLLSTGLIQRAERDCWRRSLPIAGGFSRCPCYRSQSRYGGECLWIAYLSSVVPFAWAVVELGWCPTSCSRRRTPQGQLRHPNIFAFFIVSVIALILF